MRLLQRSLVPCLCNGVMIAWVLAVPPAWAARGIPGPGEATVYGAVVTEAVARETPLARRIGRPDSTRELVRRLLAEVSALSHYRPETTLPAVEKVPLRDLQSQLCDGPCAVRAAYVPGTALLLDEALRPEVNPYHLSVLFHEVVHHVQEMQGSHAGLDECRRWQLREREAYALQNRFLAQLGSALQVRDPGAPCAADPRTQTFHVPRNIGTR